MPVIIKNRAEKRNYTASLAPIFGVGMRKVCGKCNEKVPMWWFLTSLSDERYKCSKCNSIIGFGKVVVPLLIFISVLDVIATLYLWNLRDISYNSLIDAGLNSFDINFLFLFGFFGILTLLNLVKLFIPSKILLKII